jgi:hypothetical protein
MMVLRVAETTRNSSKHKPMLNRSFFCIDKRLRKFKIVSIHFYVPELISSTGLSANGSIWDAVQGVSRRTGWRPVLATQRCNAPKWAVPGGFAPESRLDCVTLVANIQILTPCAPCQPAFWCKRISSLLMK